MSLTLAYYLSCRRFDYFVLAACHSDNGNVIAVAVVVVAVVAVAVVVVVE